MCTFNRFVLADSNSLRACRVDKIAYEFEVEQGLASVENW